MQVVITFSGSGDKLTLVPVDGRDKQFLQLLFGEAKSVRVAASPVNSPEWVVLEVEKSKRDGSAAKTAVNLPSEADVREKGEDDGEILQTTRFPATTSELG